MFMLPMFIIYYINYIRTHKNECEYTKKPETIKRKIACNDQNVKFKR